MDITDFELHLLDSVSEDDSSITSYSITSNESTDYSEISEEEEEEEEEEVYEEEDDISIISSISCKSDSTMQLFDSFHEDDVYDIIQDIYSMFDDYYDSNIIKISSPKFYTEMFDTISETLYNEWEDIDACYEDDFQQILDFVETLHEEYLLYNNIIPRSIPSNINEVKTVDIEKIRETIEYITSQPQPAQRTDEWYEFRNSLLSASSLWKALGSQSQVNSLIYEKCKAFNTEYERVSYGTSTPMHWGVKYEPVTIMIYEDLYKTKVGEFGCIRHSTYPFIGASPDGINIDPSSIKYGNMVEIKNIVNREITGIPKEDYWIQTQIQMETCKLDNCDFVETRIKEYENEEEFYNNTTNSEYRGIVLYFINNNFSENDDPVYHYMPLNIPLVRGNIEEWITQKKEEAHLNNLILFNKIYWYLDEISCVLIKRNQEWFAAAVNTIKNVWGTIQEEKIKGYEHRSPKRRIMKTIVNIDDISGSHMIHNMPTSNRICLIKLDSK
jgi:putative phage-type endonuclease